MARPTIDDATIARLTELTNDRAKVPAEQLTTNQQVSFLLEELTSADQKIRNQQNRIQNLEAKLREATNEQNSRTTPQPTGQNVGGNNQFSR